jgi:hypothetical protein
MSASGSPANAQPETTEYAWGHYSTKGKIAFVIVLSRVMLSVRASLGNEFNSGSAVSSLGFVSIAHVFNCGIKLSVCLVTHPHPHSKNVVLE